ncbi:DUF4136 domain-containing protein [Microbulbifer yueqingensis]|uniref:DUF4136 domain-containing protein n=1 Tax=Microbulbifer yueqingensis TaxID=658219 RepID=A0A1G8YAC3_9GAMM|nr:DUF4136 domain-containing protein [Microbulbifer yueqingensis]SDJ99711.1 protein of unknown function [Microbulbifer yueqingensis]
MARFRAPVLALFLFLLLGGCATAPPVALDYDPQADFSGLRTYHLLDPLATGPVSPLELKRARQAVEGILSNRYRSVEHPEDADFLVQVQMQSVEKVAVYEDRFGLYGGYRYWGFGWRAPVEVREYRQDILVVDVLSPENSPLWRASMPSRAGRYRDPAQRHQRLREEAALLLNRFPPAY